MLTTNCLDNLVGLCVEGGMENVTSWDQTFSGTTKSAKKWLSISTVDMRVHEVQLQIRRRIATAALALVLHL